MDNNKKLIYISICLLVILYINLKSYTPIRLDSLSDINWENNVVLDQTNLPQENLTLKEKAKSWCYWQAFIKNSNNYQPYSEFKRSWNNEYIFKKSIIVEWKNIKNNPINYIKDKWNFRLSRLDKERYAGGNYFEGRWVSRGELKHLHSKGYTITNGKIEKILK